MGLSEAMVAAIRTGIWKEENGRDGERKEEGSRGREEKGWRTQKSIWNMWITLNTLLGPSCLRKQLTCWMFASLAAREGPPENMSRSPLASLDYNCSSQPAFPNKGQKGNGDCTLRHRSICSN